MDLTDPDSDANPDPQHRFFPFLSLSVFHFLPSIAYPSSLYLFLPSSTFPILPLATSLHPFPFLLYLPLPRSIFSLSLYNLHLFISVPLPPSTFPSFCHHFPLLTLLPTFLQEILPFSFLLVSSSSFLLFPLFNVFLLLLIRAHWHVFLYGFPFNVSCSGGEAFCTGGTVQQILREENISARGNLKGKRDCFCLFWNHLLRDLGH